MALVIFLSGCASPRQDAAEIALQRGLKAEIVGGRVFDLHIFASPNSVPGQPLSVYVEGDGHAFITRYRLSDDPTPHNPVALKLASRDPASNLVYIARPCQYTQGLNRRNCHPTYWSDARYAPEVIEAINSVIDRQLTATGARGVLLYGHSGGGTVAALLAARRQDVVRVVTIGAVLDTEAWTKQDDMAPLSSSLNPADAAELLADIPQVHFIGENDRVVPLSVAQSYAARFAPAHRPTIKVVPGQSHDCCWAELWPGLLTRFDNGR